jgi:hypothetical protein
MYWLSLKTQKIDSKFYKFEFYKIRIMLNEKKRNLFLKGINKIQLQVHPDLRLSEKACNKINRILFKVAIKVSNHEKTMKSNLKSLMENEDYKDLYKHAISEGTQCEKKKHLNFSTKKLSKFLVTKNDCETESVYFFGGVLEYLCAEITELAGNCTRDNSREVIKCKDVKNVFKYDEELFFFFKKLNE